MRTKTPRVGSKWFYRPAGWDLFDGKAPWSSGEPVTVIQPYGCPKNGTFGHCYVADSTGYYSLVDSRSLSKS